MEGYRLSHTCHARCGNECPPKHLMCRPCWVLVPSALGALVYEFFKAGLRAGTHPSGAWMLAADAAIATVQVARDLEVRPAKLTRAMTYAQEMDGKAEATLAGRRILAAVDGPLRDLLASAWGLP